MPVESRLRRGWYRKRGKLPPEEFEAILERKKRLRRQDDAFAAECDRQDAALEE